MSTWILVIFFASAGHNGVAIDHMHGFSSESACTSAGAKLPPTRQGRILEYVCIEKK